MMLSCRMVVVLSVCVLCHACAKERIDAPAFDLEGAFATSHVPWAKPLEDGPIRGLLVAPRYTLRDAMELSQRLELSLEVVGVWDRGHPGCDASLAEEQAPGASAGEVLARLDRALREPLDVIIVGNVDLNTLPVETQSVLFRAVAGGAGLVLANHDDAAGIVFETFLEALKPVEDTSPITGGIGESVTPEWHGGLDFVRAATYGDGRVVLLPFREDKPATHCLLPALANPVHAVPEFLDSYFSLVTRAVCWAAGRDSVMRVTQVIAMAPQGPPPEEIPPDLPPEFVQTMRDTVVQSPIRTFQARFAEPAERDYGVTVQLRDPNRGLRVVYDDLPELKKGADSYTAEVLAGPGRYLLDIQLHGRRGVVLWHTEPVEVTGWPSFTNLRLSKSILLPHDNLEIALETQTFYGAARPLAIYARAIDAVGRLVADSAMPAPEGGGEVVLSLPFADLITPSVRVEVYAVPGEMHTFEDWELNMAAAEVRVLPVRQARLPHKLHLTAVTPNAYEYNARHLLDALAHAGFDSVYTEAGAAAHRHLTRMNLRPIAAAGHVSAERAEEGLVRVPCLSDPSHIAIESKRVTEAVQRYRGDGVLDYSLGNPAYLCASDENICQCAHCLDAFRARLKKGYGGLEGLNSAWGTGFAEWVEVRPSPREEALRSGHPASWADFRMFMDGVFSAYMNVMRDAILGADAQARTGFRARQDDPCMRGYHWAALARAMDWIAVSPDAALEAKLRSFGKTGGRFALAINGDAPMSPERARWLPWHAAANGCDGVWFLEPFGNAFHGAPQAALLPDGRPAAFFDAFSAAYDTVGEGLDTLLLSAVPAQARVAVYDSRASLYCDAAGPDCGARYNDAQQRIIRFLEGSGIGFDTIAGEGATADGLAAYALLVLPMARALDGKEVETIAGFAERGGHVIADLLPGVLDAHGVERAAPPLADLFGVKYAPNAIPPEPAAAPVAVPGREPAGLATGGAVADARLAAVTAQAGSAAGDVPIWLRLDTPQGIRLVLNHSFPAVAEDGDPALTHGAYALLRQALADAGIAPDVALAVPEDGWLPGERRRYRFGDADLLLAVRAPDSGPEEMTVRLDFEKGDTVYDLLARLPVPGRRARFHLGRGEAALFARLPYEVGALELIAADTVAQGERLVFQIRVKARGGVCGTHLVRVTLETMQGEELKYYAVNVRCEGGRGEGFIPLARNERTGHYVVTARDLLSGTAGQAVFRVVQRTW